MRGVLVAIGLMVTGWTVPAARAESGKTIQQAIENAAREVNAQRTQEEQAISSSLSQDLRAAIQQWLDAARAEKTAGLHQLIEQRWERLPESFGDPAHYDYYLQNADYAVDSQDVVKTSSVLVPYKATVRVLETLYVTRYYPPNTSYPEQFRYTVATPVTVEFEYRGRAFVATRTDRGPITFKKGW